MFFRGRRPDEPQLTKFELCDVKDIGFVTYYKPLDRQANRWTQEPPEDTEEYDVGIGAELYCPRSDGDIVTDSQTGRAKAVASLRSLAMTAVCPPCPYSGKTRLEADQLVAEEARARRERQRAENELEQEEAIADSLQEMRDTPQDSFRPPAEE
ncbi:MAG TPA: hypothetical protein VLF40_05705 [Candidatus Saccharimonadales bacterium]|nr:hypothetical protein [Candidatus Saccharimonadales bacterium]